MDEVGGILDTLAELAEPTGGWGYVPGQGAQPEPTCLGLLALSLQRERFAEPIARAWEALRQTARDDGTYRIARGREEAVWPTALVLFAQAALGQPAEEIGRTATGLLGLRGRIPEDAGSAEMIDIDFKIVGWPWAERNFSWAEPTAWACLALRRAGLGAHPRVAEGISLLLDRASDEGGVNYGNRRIFGRKTEPLPGPTALMLLALQQYPAQPRVAAAVEYLRHQAVSMDDLEHLAWARLALDLFRHRPEVLAALPALDEQIREAYRARPAQTWVRPAPRAGRTDRPRTGG